MIIIYKIFLLQESCRDFEENSWFDTMLFYGSKLEELVENVDDDVKLLPTIVEKIIQPRLTGKIGNLRKRAKKSIFVLFITIFEICNI